MAKEDLLSCVKADLLGKQAMIGILDMAVPELSEAQLDDFSAALKQRRKITAGFYMTCQP